MKYEVENINKACKIYNEVCKVYRLAGVDIQPSKITTAISESNISLDICFDGSVTIRYQNEEGEGSICVYDGLSLWFRENSITNTKDYRTIVTIDRTMIELSSEENNETIEVE